uniref:Protein kinase domain-containing protein n=1 Tax=Oryza barthii TaxID=65489 RepID=A0A0D3G134_9ORYZ
MSTAVAIISSVSATAAAVVMLALIKRCRRYRRKMKKKMLARIAHEATEQHREMEARDAADSVMIEIGPVEKFLNEILSEKPMRFTSEQLAACTGNYSSELGSGGFGVVYRGELPNGLQVAVKVLKVSMNKKVQEAFMAEIGTIGRTYHVHLVRLYGFCFDADTKALVYEFLENGSLEKYLYGGGGEDRGKKLEWRTLHDIAVGTAKGIRYLHEECQQRIVHYDIKPANILLTADFTPKVADFGLARLGERENTHMSLTGGRGTPGYAAPELWMALPATEKCDVYSFGMVLFEVLGRRRNYDLAAQAESQEWFPKWVWDRYEQGDMECVVSAAGIGEEDRAKAEMMCKVALWCVQFQPSARPTMSSVVRMLEGEMAIVPPVNPFHYVMSGGSGSSTLTSSSTNLSSGGTTTGSSEVAVSLPAKKSTDVMKTEIRFRHVYLPVRADEPSDSVVAVVVVGDEPAALYGARWANGLRGAAMWSSPSSIRTTLPMDGLSSGLYCTHHSATMHTLSAFSLSLPPPAAAAVARASTASLPRAEPHGPLVLEALDEVAHAAHLDDVRVRAADSAPAAAAAAAVGDGPGIIIGGIAAILVLKFIMRCVEAKHAERARRREEEAGPVSPPASGTYSSVDVRVEMGSVDRFLDDILREKPARFTPENLREFTGDYAERLGAGGFGVVYRGRFPGGVQVAVKILHRTLDRRAEEQFMAEVATAGRTYHINLVRLYGFCFDATTKALVYEYLENGSLDRVLFDAAAAAALEFDTLHGIVVGTARGVRYLHEECQHRIIHYDIKPGNVLLAGDYAPKVADFGLAKLCSRDNTHLTMTGARGTPGYAAPELWLPLPVTHKCDVYSFGMLVFEILGRRRSLDTQRPAESQEWYPRWAWQRFDQGRFGEVMAASGIRSKDGEKAERMCKVALWCIQYQPEARPSMSSVVRMLEGEEQIARPVNPFAYMATIDAISSSSSGGGGVVSTSASASGDSAQSTRHDICH